MTLPSVVFVRRQSPDWRGLSRDQRRGAQIDPARYVPDHYIPGFPERVDLLINQWNKRFKIDFFTFRFALSNISRKSIASVANARFFSFHQMKDVVNHAANEDFYVYFHDDDDFFAPNLAKVVSSAKTRPDAIVTPMFRLAIDGHLTFVRKQCSPEFIWGRRKLHDFRYQTNNYGVSSRRCTSRPALFSVKDHVLASRYADDNGYTDEVLPSIISATVKTPASASMLPIFLHGSDGYRAAFHQFIESCRSVAEFPQSYIWISEPIRTICQLVKKCYRGDGYNSIGDLLYESPTVS